jgi:hypothetical protein
MPFGMPKIPKTNTRRTATIRRVLRMGVAIRFFAGLTVYPRNTVI